MKIDRFDAGLQTRLDPSLIPYNAAVAYKNINNTSGKLASSKDITNLGIEARGFVHNYNGTWISSYTERSYVEYRNVLYYTNVSGEAKKYYNLSEMKLGINKPTSAPLIQESAAFSSLVDLLDVSADIIDGQGLYINSFGYDLFVIDNTNDKIVHYYLSDPWNITTATLSGKELDISSKETNGRSLTFNSSGTRLYIIGDNANIYQYNLSIAWDLDTAIFSTNKSVSVNAPSPHGFQLSVDGTKAFILDDSTNKILGYSLSTPFALSTLSYTTDFVDLSSIETSPRDMIVKSDGLRLYLIGSVGDKVSEFVLNTAWDISTCTYYGELADIVIETTDATGLFMSEALDKMYVIGDTTGSNIWQYNIKRTSNESSVVQYVYTFYNSTLDIESAPSEISEELSLSSVRSVTISNLENPNDTQVDKIRIYRIGGTLTDFYLVAEIAFSDTSYIDGTPDTQVTDVLSSENNYPPIEDLRYLVEAYGVMFAVQGTKVYFSKQGSPDYWPTENFIEFNNSLTGLLPMTLGILVFSNSSTSIILGTPETSFSKVKLSENLGCIEHFSGQVINGMPLWLSKEGFCSLAGYTVKNVTKEILGTQTFSIINSTVQDETYWAALDNGTLLAIDLRFGISIKEYEFSSAISGVAFYDGDLFVVSTGDKLYSVFTGDNLELYYKSPVFIGENYSEVKLYNNIYVAFNGTFDLSIYIDGVKVVTHSISGTKPVELTVPEDYQRGYSIQFEIEGVGTIKEIEFKEMGRQNGR